MNKLKIAVIGTGLVGSFHAETFFRNPNSELIAVCDINKEKVNKNQLEQFARLTADKYGETFTKVEGEGDMAGDGIYMVGNAMVKVSGGVPKILIGA